MNGLKYSEKFKLRLDIIYPNIWLCTMQEKGLNEFRYLAHFVATQTFLALTVFSSQQIIFAELNIRKTHRWKNWFLAGLTQCLRLTDCCDAENDLLLTALPDSHLNVPQLSSLNAGHPNLEFLFQSGIILFDPHTWKPGQGIGQNCHQRHGKANIVYTTCLGCYDSLGQETLLASIPPESLNFLIWSVP
jgi:hypothetical protein